MSSYESAPQNEARNHEEEKNQRFFVFRLTGFSMIPKNSASSSPRFMSSQAPETPKNARRLISKSDYCFIMYYAQCILLSPKECISKHKHCIVSTNKPLRPFRISDWFIWSENGCMIPSLPWVTQYNPLARCYWGAHPRCVLTPTQRRFQSFFEVSKVPKNWNVFVRHWNFDWFFPLWWQKKSFLLLSCYDLFL